MERLFRRRAGRPPRGRSRQANPGFYITLPLAIPFPFNVVAGIPL